MSIPFSLLRGNYLTRPYFHPMTVEWRLNNGLKNGQFRLHSWLCNEPGKLNMLANIIMVLDFFLVASNQESCNYLPAIVELFRNYVPNTF